MAGGCPHRVEAPAGCCPTELGVAELLLAAGQGHPEAWEEILRRYHGVVVGRCRSFRLQDADMLDAVQMTWLRLVENAHQIRRPEHLSGWLATTASRECLRILNQAKRDPIPTDAAVDNVVDAGVSPEQRMIDAETVRTLRTLLAELPPGRRRLLRALFTDHPRPYAELARAIGIPIGSIGPTRARALHQLRQMLEGATSEVLTASRGMPRSHASGSLHQEHHRPPTYQTARYGTQKNAVAEMATPLVAHRHLAGHHDRSPNPRHPYKPGPAGVATRA